MNVKNSIYKYNSKFSFIDMVDITVHLYGDTYRSAC